MKYLKEFQNHSQYTAYIASEGKILPNVSTCIQEDDVHYTQLTCEVGTIYELVGNPSYPSEIEGSETSFEMSFNYKRTDIDNRCRKKISYGSDSVTINVGYNPSTTSSRVIENTYNYNGLAVPYSITQTKLDAKVTAKFNVTSTSDSTKILDDTSSVYSVEIDGVLQPSVTSAYTFGTTGEHTVVYTLKSPSINSYFFKYCYKLTDLTIGSGITSINMPITMRCDSLSSITVDNTNTIYDSRNNCNAIIETATNTLVQGCKDTVIPNTVTSIGNSAFLYCTSLTSINIPDNVVTIGNSSFGDCSGLTSCTIGSGVTSIGNSSFSDCSGLTSMVIPDSVTSIGNYALAYCKSLTSCTIGSGVTSIGQGAFYWSSKLKSIVIPDGVKAISVETFNLCKGLTSCTIGSGVTIIYDNAFKESGIKNITIPDNVKTINSNAFYWCDNLKSVTISSGTTNIGNTAFNRCSGLTSITVDVNNPVYDSRNNCNGIIETATNTLTLGCKGTVIPNTVTAIGNKAFYRCNKLTSMVIPNSVVTIGGSAFSDCWSLTSVTIPNSVTTINGSAFSSCINLSSITLPSSLTTIGRSVFFGTNITTITSLATTAPTIVNYTFYGSENDGTLYVPIGSTGYDVWMSSDDYYLGKYNWTKVEQ